MAVQVTPTMQTQIANLYIAILGRNPEPPGFAYWTDNYANNGGTAAALTNITLAFAKSPEFVATYGGQTTQSAIGLMYQNVLGRTADAGGLAYWTNIANNYISQGYKVAEAYALTGNNIITAAAANTGTADATLIASKQAAAVASGTAAPTTPYTLTTSIDTVTGQNRAVEGTGTTFTAYDSIDVTGTNNSLVINDTTGASASGVPTGVSISGVQRAEILSSAGSIGSTSSATATSQSQVFTYTASTSAATSTITAGGVSVTATNASGSGDSSGSEAADAAVTALTGIYNSLGYTVVSSTASSTLDAANKVAIVKGTPGTTTTVTVTSFPGTSIPFASVTEASNATQLPLIANTAAVASATPLAYDVSDWDGLTSFVGGSSGSINLLASDETTLTLDADGAVTVEGGAGDSLIFSNGAVSIGATTSPSRIANAFTSLTLDGSSTTVDITDNSGTLSDGVTVAVGSTLKTVSIAGKTGTATLTGNGITAVNLTDSIGATTVNNTTAGHSMALGLSGVGYSGSSNNFTDANATSLAISTSATTSAATGNALNTLSVAKVAALSVSGTKSLSIATVDATKLATVTISGSGGVTADFSSAGATSTAGFVTSVDTTGSTAVLSAASGTTANNLTIGTSTTFTGGAGNDSVTVGASTKTLDFGAGTDTLILTTAALGTGGSAIGGGGTDTIQMTIANAATAGSSSGKLNAAISGFERLSLEGATLTGNVTVDLGFLSNLNSYVRLGANAGDSGTRVLTIDNLSNNGTLQLSGDAGSAYAAAVSIKDSAYSTSNVLNVIISKTANTARTGGTLTANGIQTVNISTSNTTTSGLTSSTDTLTLAANAVKTIVISGNAGLTLTNTNTTVTSVDASGITSVTTSSGTTEKNGFTWVSGALTNATNTGVTVIGTSSGANDISLDSITNTLISSTVTLGGAANTSANKFLGGAGVDTVTGSGGADKFQAKESIDIITTGAGQDIIYLADLAVDRDIITDFTAGSGGQADAIYLAGYSAATTFAVGGTIAANSFTVALVDTGSDAGNVIEFAFEANSAVNLNSGAADSLTGVNLLKGLNNGITEATLTVSGTNVSDADVGYIVAYQGGNAYVYDVAVSSAGTTITGSEIVLVGVLNNVAVGGFTSANFSATEFTPS